MITRSRLGLCIALITALGLLLLEGCGKPKKVVLPPITEGWKKHSAVQNGYVIQPKDSLYSIAWAFGLDYRFLAEINHLQYPYKLRSGQRLLITVPTTKKLDEIKKGKIISKLEAWRWPTQGKLIAKPALAKENHKNQGIDIAGTLDQTIFASNHGTVVYAGTGIKFYGKLIIIKHSDDCLSAYAYNKEIWVTEGDIVNAGQKIASMGYHRSGKAMLHFEIRMKGIPVNPLNYLPKN